MVWLDLLILVLLVLSVSFGYKRGFILTLFSVGSYVIGFLFSKRYYGELTTWIRNQFSFTDKVYDFIGGNIELNVPIGANTIPMDDYSTNQVASLLNQEAFEMPSFVQNFLFDQLDVQTFAQQTVEGIRNQIIDTLATMFLNIISMLILFVLIRWVIVAIGIVIDRVFDLPILGTFNQMLGGVLGGVRGLFLIIIMLFILIPISMSSPQGLISVSIEESYLVQFFLNNIVIHLVRGLGAIVF